jgi:hypothetical protein
MVGISLIHSLPPQNWSCSCITVNPEVTPFSSNVRVGDDRSGTRLFAFEGKARVCILRCRIVDEQRCRGRSFLLQAMLE